MPIAAEMFDFSAVSVGQPQHVNWHGSAWLYRPIMVAIGRLELAALHRLAFANSILHVKISELDNEEVECMRAVPARLSSIDSTSDREM